MTFAILAIAQQISPQILIIEPLIIHTPTQENRGVTLSH